MAYTFKQTPVAAIKANVTGTSDSLTISGTNVNTTPENAKAQIDKLLALTGSKTVAVDGMIQTQTREATDNG